MVVLDVVVMRSIAHWRSFLQKSPKTVSLYSLLASSIITSVDSVSFFTRAHCCTLDAVSTSTLSNELGSSRHVFPRGTGMTFVV